MPQYQGVWTLEQQAQAQSNQQWVTDPNFKNTTLLLQADGTGSGSQNNTFLDGSTNNFFVTRYGNTTQGSFSPFSQAPGYWGNYFTSAGLSIPYAAALQLENTNWTIEGYFNLSSASAEFCVMGASNGGGGVPKYFMGGNWSTSFTYNANRATFFTYTGGDRWIDVPYAWEIGKWYHMAAVYTSSNTTITLYINGVNVGSMAYGIGNVTGNVLIGRNGENGGPINGYISNFRYIVGTSLYTSNFTPSTTPLTAITNTQILTCQSNSFIDNSGNSRAVSIAAGTPSVQAFGPFAPALQWTPDVVGGSGYFDGTGDYLTFAPGASFAFGTGDFTIEQWFYAPSTLPTYAYLIDARNSGQTANWATGFNLNNTGTGQFTFFDGVSGTAYNESSVSYKPAAWNHCVVVRSGTTFSMFMNGARVYTTTNSTNFSTSSTLSYIGRGQATGSEFYFPGYMASLRIVKGTAVYSPSSTTLTVPTAPVTAITNTSLLLNMTNAGIYDGKMNTSWETTNNVQVSTSVVKYGSGSMYFDGTANQRLLPSQSYPQFTYGTGDFTIECWIYVIGKNATSAAGIYDGRPGVNGTYPSWWVDFGGYGVGSATAPRLVWYADSAVFMSSGVISMGAWNHIAFSRANGVSRMYINGVISGSPTADTKNYLGGGSAGNFRPVIGSSDGGDSLYGYFDDFRISRFARYIANFTPPQQALPRQ